jgi:hypothetical protein
MQLNVVCERIEQVSIPCSKAHLARGAPLDAIADVGFARTDMTKFPLVNDWQAKASQRRSSASANSTAMNT